MADYTTTIMDSLLKEVYTKEIIDGMRTAFPLLDRFKKWPKNMIGGKHFNVNVYMTEGDSVMSYAEGSSLSARRGLPVFEQMQIPLTYLSGTFQLTGQAIEGSKRNEWAIRDAMDTAKMDLMVQLHRRQTLDFLGSHNGVRAEVKTAVVAGDTAIVVYAPGGNENLSHAGYSFKRGDRIYIKDATNPQAFVVKSVDHGAPNDTINVVTAASAAISANAPIYFGTGPTDIEENLSPHGLLDIFNDSADYMGISVTEYPDWKPYFYNGGTPVPFSKKDFTDFLIQTHEWAGGKPNIVLCNTELVSELQELFDTEVRRSPLSEIKGGMKSITWSVLGMEVEFFFHDFIHPGSIYALDEKYMWWGNQKEGGFLPKGGNGVVYRLDGQDVYRADWNKYYNLFTKKRNAHGLMVYTLK